MTKLLTIISSLFLLISFSCFAGEKSDNSECKSFKLNISGMKSIGEVDKRFQSFNIEMCEVVGGDFWIPYNLVDSVRKTSNRKGIDALKWPISPINLYEKKLRMLAAALGPTYIRVSVS